MMSWSPKCYIPSFVVIGSVVPEKKLFEVFFTIYGRGGHLGHVTQNAENKLIIIISFRTHFYPAS